MPSKANEVPPEARVDSQDGAAEFVKFATEKVNTAYQQSDPGSLDQVFAPECPGCMAIKDDVQKYAGSGRRVVGNSWVNVVTIPDTWSPGRATVELTVDQQAADIIDSLGRKTGNFKAGHYSFIVTMTYNGAWRITRWQRLET